MAYVSVTLAQLRGMLQARYTGDPFWVDQEATDAINEALRWFNAYTGYWRTTVTVATVAFNPFITIPASLTYRTRVYRPGRALTQKSIVELYRQRRNWRTDATTDGGDTPTVIREWAPVGLTRIAIWPADGVGGTVLTLDGVRVTPVLTTNASVLDLGEEELNLILSEAIWILTFKRPSLIETMREKHQTFLQGCMERNDQLRESAHFRQALGLDQQQRLEPVHLPKSEEAFGKA